MFSINLMNPSKETDNKLRWTANVEGTPFHFYIPKSRVPKPWPNQIHVIISLPEQVTQSPTHLKNYLANFIIAFIKFDQKHSCTVRYSPEGDSDQWEIGQPYIPYEILEKVSPGTIPDRLRIEVHWDDKAGIWQE